jgi:hypothetical protein
MLMHFKRLSCMG